MIADLPMYDWPGLRDATDAFWAELSSRLRQAGVAAPARLARTAPAEAPWRDPDLLLGQTCGMPFVAGHCGTAEIVARPDYGLPEAAAGVYRSVIVAAAGDTETADNAVPDALLARRGCRVAVNEWCSYSGHVALRMHLAALREDAAAPFFGAAILSGSHAESARMVARGVADVAALDGVVWALLQAREPETAARLMVLDRTAPAPALPFICAPSHAGLRDVLAAALDGAAAALPPVAGLPRRVLPADAPDYEPIRAAAERAGAEAFAPGAPHPLLPGKRRGRDVVQNRHLRSATR